MCCSKAMNCRENKGDAWEGLKEEREGGKMTLVMFYFKTYLKECVLAENMDSVSSHHVSLQGHFRLETQ